MSRFPKLSETFVLYEMLGLRQLGFTISVWALVVRANIGSTRTCWGVGDLSEDGARRAAGRRPADRSFHCHFSSHPAAAGLIAHRLSGIPFSFTAHGSDLHVDRHMLCEKVPEASFVVAISEYNRRLIADHCGPRPAARTVVIRSGVDTAIFHPPPDGDAERGARFTIVCVGRLTEVKGQPYLVEACRLLDERGVDFVCQFVGDGPLRASLERQVERAGLGERVRFLGERRREEIAALLRAATVLALPSVPTRDGRREGIPVVLMEAMASGRPVVASNLSGIPELVEHERSGLLIEARDTRGLASALERLHGDAVLRQRLGEAARQKVVAEFGIEATARQLAARIRATLEHCALR